MRILGVVSGRLLLSAPQMTLTLAAGQFCLLPASLGPVEVRAEVAADFLITEGGG